MWMENLIEEMAGNALYIYQSFFGPLLFAWLDMIVVALAAVILVFACGWVSDRIHKTMMRKPAAPNGEDGEINPTILKDLLLIMVVPNVACVVIALLTESVDAGHFVIWPHNRVGILHILFLAIAGGIAATRIGKRDIRMDTGEEVDPNADKMMASIAACICEVSAPMEQIRDRIAFAGECMDRYVPDEALSSILEEIHDMKQGAEAGRRILARVIDVVENGANGSAPKIAAMSERELRQFEDLKIVLDS